MTQYVMGEERFKRIIDRMDMSFDLNNSAGTYDLFSSVGGEVLLEEFIFQCPNENADGTLAGISIQTDHTNPTIIIDKSNGKKKDLKAEAQLLSDTPVLLQEGKKIQLTIYGGPNGSEYLCGITAKYSPLVEGAYLSI